LQQFSFEDAATGRAYTMHLPKEGGGRGVILNWGPKKKNFFFAAKKVFSRKSVGRQFIPKTHCAACHSRQRTWC